MVNKEKLSAKALSILSDSDNVLLVSHPSLFEISIKQQIDKLPEFSASMPELIERLILDDFRIFPIQTEHISCYAKVPFYDDHRDPFDRLLLATALSENVPNYKRRFKISAL